MSVLKAWVPYVLIAVILVVTRIPELGVKDILSKGPFVVEIKNLLGFAGLDWSLKWAYVPGTAFILVALITNVFHKMNGEQIKQSWKDTYGQVAGAAIAIVFGLALTKVLSFTPEGGESMMKTMAEALAQVGGTLFVVISPFIGVLGSFVSGSATVSMTLFTNLQFDTATALGIPAVFAVAMQCVGGAVGNMVCINNAVAASATIGTAGKEGKLIKLNVVPMVIYTLATVAVFMVAMSMGITG